MRDVFAGVVAIVLLLVAASLGTTLRGYRTRRQRARDSERALGRTIVAEIPGAGDLVLFSEDAVRFHYGERSIDKDLVVAVRVLINGVPIAEARRQMTKQAGERGADGVHRWAGASGVSNDRGAGAPGVSNDRGGGPTGVIEAAAPARPEGIARDRWDVEIEAANGTLLIECGDIRERVSQELARSVFDAVKRALGRS